ncbi:MAG: DNA-binding protein [Deltaproteobacteria bacterium HGW-Deltaproteobacteria-15]|jgi:hypothetical protein|nr:MAG: DNA-binding protein [Deltaproteobacteria bacterium HGW-Deltaproteobacteria-15]
MGTIRADPVNTGFKLLKDFEAATFLCVASGTMRNWRYSGQGPPYLKLGRLIRYRFSDLAIFLERRRIDPEGIGKSKSDFV